MKTFNLLLVLVLALGAFALAPQSETLAAPAPVEVPERPTEPGCEMDCFVEAIECQSEASDDTEAGIACVLAYIACVEACSGGGDPVAHGTVHCIGNKCQSGFDMADCSAGACKLMNGFNFVNVPAGPYKVYAQTLTSAPGGLAGLKLQPKPVNVYFNPAETLAFVEVCFPKGNGTGQVFKHSNAGWLPLPTSFYGGLACGTAWGGGTFGYFK